MIWSQKYSFWGVPVYAAYLILICHKNLTYCNSRLFSCSGCVSIWWESCDWSVIIVWERHSLCCSCWLWCAGEWKGCSPLHSFSHEKAPVHRLKLTFELRLLYDFIWLLVSNLKATKVGLSPSGRLVNMLLYDQILIGRTVAGFTSITSSAKLCPSWKSQALFWNHPAGSTRALWTVCSSVVFGCYDTEYLQK